MRLGWKIFLPTSIVAVVVVSGWLVAKKVGVL
jgi:NADH:ubiquinone oxidoreductase subunit H